MGLNRDLEKLPGVEDQSSIAESRRHFLQTMKLLVYEVIVDLGTWKSVGICLDLVT